ncbi:hypothetical protein C8R45DRAFT_138091 [Mycena sanguinolenta]|nr:hypothetical protein C8R45DRAFT_138091 [Mycena sanguinolenta]
MHMPGRYYLSTPPTSPGKLPETETEKQTTPIEKSAIEQENPSAPKLTVSTSQMSNNDALVCVTWPSNVNGDANTLGLSVVLTPELLAVGELVAAMKRVVGVLGTTFDALGAQTARVAELGPALKAAEHIKQLRAHLAEVIQRSDAQAAEVQTWLQEAVKQTLSDEVKAHIRATVAREVNERVAYQLNEQIPDRLRQQIKSHKRQILEVQRSLHNSEARQHNSALGVDALTVQLRPLLRPLASAEQSPMPLPWTPVLVPMLEEEAPPTPSPLFPRDLKALFALNSEDAEVLVRDYGLGGEAPPVTPIVALMTPGAEADSRERNLNRFMAHIGVVGFQMHGFLGCGLSSQEENMLSTIIIRERAVH